MPSSAQLINDYYGRRNAGNQRLAELSYKIARDRLLSKQRQDSQYMSRKISLIANGFVPSSVDSALSSGDLSLLQHTDSISERQSKAKAARNKEFSDWLFSGDNPVANLPYRDQEQAIVGAGYGDVPTAWKHLQSIAKADQMKRLSAKLGQISQKPQADVANILALTQALSQINYGVDKDKTTAKDKRKSSRDAAAQAEKIWNDVYEALGKEEGAAKATRILNTYGQPGDLRMQAIADSLSADSAEARIPDQLSRAAQLKVLIQQLGKTGNQSEALDLLPFILDTQYDDDIEQYLMEE